MDAKDLPVQGEAVSKSLQIVAELQASLNLDEGGEVGAALFRLYDYVTMELVRANMHDDRDGLMMCGSLTKKLMPKPFSTGGRASLSTSALALRESGPMAKSRIERITEARA